MPKSGFCFLVGKLRNGKKNLKLQLFTGFKYSPVFHLPRPGKACYFRLKQDKRTLRLGTLRNAVFGIRLFIRTKSITTQEEGL